MTLLDALTLDWQTKRILSEKMGCPVREVELEINAARLAGAAIVSSGDGYRLARSSAELLECLERLRRRAVTQFLTTRAMRRTAKRMAAEEARPLAFEWAA